MHLRLLALLLALVALAAGAATAAATPVATSDNEYQALGRVFPDPLAGCQGAGSPCSPSAEGNVPATQFIGIDEFLNALKYMNTKPEWQRYMEVWPLDGKLDDTVGQAQSGTDEKAAFPGNNLGSFEFTPHKEFTSAGLPTPDLSRETSDLIMVRVTDETVPDAGKKRYALSLSIHGIERAGAEGGIRAMEDLVTAHTTKRDGKPVVDAAVKPGAATFADVLKKTIVYFTLPNPDGWRRGSVSSGSSGGVFFQRYNGNGVDPNRDWPDVGAAFRGYSSESEPETRAWISAYKDIRTQHGPFAAGDDLHGQPEADALSYTLLPHGRHDFGKDLRIRETAKLINRAQYEAVKWSPIIQDNDKPVGGGAPCAPGALGDTCAKIYAQTWGSVYDTINYTTTGASGDWFDSAVGLQADGIDNEMSFSHLDKNIVFEPQTEQLHVDGNKAIIFSHLARILDPVGGKFDAPGPKGYVPNLRLHRDAQRFQPTPPDGTVAQDPIDGTAPDGTFPFTVLRTNPAGGKPGIYNGGMRVDATAPNAQGISTGMATLKVQCKGCDEHVGVKDNADWVTVAEDFNQSPLYAQAGITAAVNRPQALTAAGKPVEWRAVVEGPGGTPLAADVKVVFSQDAATSGGATGGDAPPELRAYDVANTDFFPDLNKFTASDDENFAAVDPRKVIDGTQSLDGLSSLALADDPLPGYTGSYGHVLTGTAPAGFDFTGDTTTPGAYDSTVGAPRAPGTYTEKDFTIKPEELAAGIKVHVEWADPTNDFDLRLYRVASDGSQTLIAESAQSMTAAEDIVFNSPLDAGNYAVIVDNYASSDPAFTGTVRFPEVAPPSSDTGAFTVADKDAWFSKLRAFAASGGNLVLTDGALRALPELTDIPAAAVKQQTVYAGQVTFATAAGKTTLKDPLASKPAVVAQPGARFNSGMRRQTYEPTPLGFPIQTQDLAGGDKSFARQYDVDKAAFQNAGGRVAGTSADSGARDAVPVYDRVALGEIPVGMGDIRVIGALLPQPTEQFDHEFGLEPYATTYTGYILTRNLFEVPLVTVNGAPTARTACAASAGFLRAAVKPLSKGRMLRFDFAPNGKNAVTVDVFQASAGRRVLSNRLVARFTNRRKAFTWNGKGTSGRKVTDGSFFVRYRIKLAGGGTDDRRFAVRRANGRLAKRADFYGRASCNVLSAFKLERPAFGGAANRPLHIAFRLRRSAKVSVTVFKGKKAVKRFKTSTRKRNVTHRLTLSARGLRVGDYKVRITVSEKGRKPVKGTLTSRRI